MENSSLEDEFKVFKRAIFEFSQTVENDVQLHIYIKESRRYIEFLITYYLGLGKLDQVKDKINKLDLELLDEIERIAKKIG